MALPPLEGTALTIFVIVNVAVLITSTSIAAYLFVKLQRAYPEFRRRQLEQQRAMAAAARGPIRAPSGRGESPPAPSSPPPR